MRTFKKGNWLKSDDVCPICKTQKTGEIVLIPIVDTKEGNIMQAIQTHTDCLQEQLMYYPEREFIGASCNI